MISGTYSEPSSGLNMDQLNDLLGSFKSDIISGIDERFSSFQAPTAPAMPDYSNQFSGLEQRLAGLETQLGSIQMPAYEPADYSGQFGGLEDKIAGIEQQLSSLPTPAGVDYNKISSLVSDQVNQAVSGIQIPTYQAPDLSGIEQQISGINDRFNQLPGTDYGKINDMIQGAVGGINIPDYQAPDLSTLTGRLDQLDSRFDNLPQTDLSPLQDQLGMLNDRFNNMPQVDLSGIEQQIGGINDRFNNLPGTDYGKIQGMVDNAISGIDIPTYEAPDLSALTGRLDALDDRFSNFQAPAVDLNPITSQIEDLKTQFGNLQPQQVDLSGLTGQIGGLQSQLDGFMNDDRFKGPSFAQIDPAIMDQLTQTNASLGEQIMGLDNRLDQIALGQQNMTPGLTSDELDQRLSMIDDRFGSFDQRLNDALNREDPFVTALNAVYNGDYEFNLANQNYDFRNIFPSIDPIEEPGGAGGGYSPPGGGYTPPASPVTPPPASNPSLPPQIADPVDWNRYGRDYGELDFNVGGTAGNQPAASTFQPGQGGVNLQDLLANLGL